MRKPEQTKNALPLPADRSHLNFQRSLEVCEITIFYRQRCYFLLYVGIDFLFELMLERPLNIMLPPLHNLKLGPRPPEMTSEDFRRPACANYKINRVLRMEKRRRRTFQTLLEVSRRFQGLEERRGSFFIALPDFAACPHVADF